MELHPISVTYLDRQVARAAAALPGAGAYDATPLELYCPGFQKVMLYFTYTRGGAGGAFTFRVEVSSDSSGATPWYQLSANTIPAVVAGADDLAAFQREAEKYVSQGVAAERVAFGAIELGGTVERIRIPACESGNVGAPGTLAILAVFGM